MTEKATKVPVRRGRPSASAEHVGSVLVEESVEASEVTKDPQFVTALARGLQILRCFHAQRQDLGTSEIARLTGLPQPTVWRLCKTLSALGYLVPGKSPDRLQVGAAVLTLGHAAITHAGIAVSALAPMRALAERYGVSVSLAERDGSDMVVVQRIEAPSILHLNMHVGSTLELADSSLGWAWLSAQPVSVRGQVAKELKKHYGARWPHYQARIEKAYAEYAAQGYVCNFALSHADVNAIGVPLLALHGGRCMALTCGGAKSSLTEDKLRHEVAPALLALAQELAPLLAMGGMRAA